MDLPLSGGDSEPSSLPQDNMRGWYEVGRAARTAKGGGQERSYSPAGQAATSWAQFVTIAASPAIGRLLAQRVYCVSTAGRRDIRLVHARIGLIAEGRQSLCRARRLWPASMRFRCNPTAEQERVV